MTSRKRGRAEMEEGATQPAEQPIRYRLRTMWEFANLMQYIFIFGEAVKIDKDLGIEVRDSPCFPWPLPLYEKPTRADSITLCCRTLKKNASSRNPLPFFSTLVWRF